MSDKGRSAVSSISDIARLAGVSASTVSRALAGNKMISAETRAKINELAREHGFQLNQMARNLRLKRTNAIGIVFPQGHQVSRFVSDPFFTTMLGGIADGVSERGYDLLLTRVAQTESDWLDMLVHSGRVDGVIVVGQSDQQSALARTGATAAPVVVWGEYTEGQGYCSVGTDNVAGGALAAAHLLKAGRRRILFAGPTTLPEIAARHAGYVQAHREAGVAPLGHVPASLTAEAAHALFVGYFAAHPAPDGLVAGSDVIAAAAIRALRERGLSVPDDVAIVGYDDVPMAAQMTPALTTVRQDVRQGAAHLVDRLFRRIGVEPCESVVMKPELVIRASAP